MQRVRMRERLAAAMLGVIGAALLAAAALAPGATGSGGVVRIGVAPILPGGAVRIGLVGSRRTVHGFVVLAPRDAGALKELIADGARRGGHRRGDRVPRGAFAARFGAGAQAVAAVRSALRARGLKVGHVESDGLLLPFSGSAGAAQAAFSTRLAAYRLPRGGIATASTGAPALPAYAARYVAAVVGLDRLPRSSARALRRRARGARLPAAKSGTFTHPAGSPHACVAAAQAAGTFGGLTDDQIANAYGAFGLYAQGDTGQGVNIGVFEQEPFLPADIERFDRCYFGAGAAAQMRARLHVIALEGGIPQGPGSDGEALLDVEDVSAMAPGATLDVYENPETPNGELAQIAAMVQADRDQIITSSYGQPCEAEEQRASPGLQQALNLLLEQAAAQGQTFLSAAGDSGSDSCEEWNRETSAQPGQNPVSTGEFSSQPYALAVGGTTITDAASVPAREHVWNDGGSGGAGGGGISEGFAMPSWQRLATVPGIDFPGSEDYEHANEVERRFGYKPGFCDAALHGIPQGTPCRLVPDVSAQADWETGAITVYSREYRGSGEEQSPSGWVTSGGTSSATPIWAGMLALADASPGCRANPATAGGVGFAPPLLYAIASNPTAYAASFNDITHGNNDQYNLDGGGVFPARRGFDLASGLGSPRMTGPGGTPGLAWYVCTYAGQASRPTVTSLAPSSGPTTGGTQLTIHGTGFTAEGQPAVGGVQIGIWHASASAIEVTGPETLTVRLPAARLTLPAHAPSGQTGAGPAQVIVTTLDGQSSAPGPGSTFQYYESAAGGALPAVTGVTPYGGSEGSPEPVTILGAGFGAGDRVSFGGRAGTNVRILDPGRILVTPPAYTPATQCSPLPAAAPYAGENALNDICQVQVVVTGPGGSSQPSEILPPFEGAPSYEQDGGLRRPGGCGCEIYPAQTEYDYAPAPAISSISTSQGAQAMASETGGSLVTIHGTGLGRFTFDYARFDSPRLEALLEIENIDASIAYITGTEIRLAAPALVEEAAQASVRPRSLGIALRTLAGETGEAPITYAGIPRVTGVTNPADPRELEGLPGITQDAGQQLVVRGQGMTGQVLQARLAAIGGGPEAASEQLGVRGPDSIEVTTPREHPALDDVRLCTVTGCSTAGHGDRVLVYPPGRPQVTSLSPDSGPAAGGTLVTIGGRNLACPLSISFADRPAARFTAAQALEDCGPGTAPTVSSPSGSALTEVPVTVETLSSFFSGTAPSPSKARFGYGP